MGEPASRLLRGRLNLLILKALSLEPMHGVGLGRRVHQMTGGQLDASCGSLFPALHRMEEQGWIEGEWKVSENNRRAKVYRITRTGRGRLRSEEKDWKRAVQLINTALETT